jgi:shikimate kinase
MKEIVAVRNTTLNIALIGMPGAGKSVVGKVLAEKLGLAFLDADAIIEKDAGLKLRQIIARYGEAAFLEREQKAIIGLGDFKNHVICPGGSVVYSPAAMNFLQENAIIVFLDASLENIKKRAGNIVARGVVGAHGKSLEALFHERLPLYKKYAELIIPVAESFDPEHIAGQILHAVFLRGQTRRGMRQICYSIKKIVNRGTNEDK